MFPMGGGNGGMAGGLPPMGMGGPPPMGPPGMDQMGPGMGPMGPPDGDMDEGGGGMDPEILLALIQLLQGGDEEGAGIPDDMASPPRPEINPLAAALASMGGGGMGGPTMPGMSMGGPTAGLGGIY